MGSLTEAESFLNPNFTHIVVGGGTAGLVVAARLSENPALTVEILEAGLIALDEPTINVPGRLGETLFTKYDWQFETTPQPGFNGRKLPWNQGKVWGGRAL
jgi:choline dehydrogenase-like flavoprotein